MPDPHSPKSVAANTTPNDTKETKKIVILGAGFGGLAAALELAQLKQKYRKKTDFEVVLIDRNDYQLFTSDLYEVASASQKITSEKQLKDVICLDIRIALGKQSIGFIKAEVHTIDTKRQLVHTSKKEVPYDYLIIALGSESNFFGIPGMAQHSLPLKTVQDGFHIRKTVHQLINQKRDVHVIVCGGGPAGVELAAEMRRACKNEKTGLCPAMTIVEGKESVLMSFGPKVSDLATRRLQKLGVHQKTEFMIAKAGAGKVVSRTGEELHGDLIIWTGGIKSSSIIESSKIPTTEHGQIAVHETLQTKDTDNVFAIGDLAEVIVGGVRSPQTAHEAVHQGPVVARNIVRYLCGETMQPYVIKNEGFVITLGGKNGIVLLPNGWVLNGFIGWFIRVFVDFRHFRSVLPFMRACSVWYQSVKMLTKND